MRKAWLVFHGSWHMADYVIIAFAETRGRAKQFLRDYEDFTDYIEWRARRLPEYDDIADSKGKDWHAACNWELPGNRSYWQLDWD